MTKTNNTEIPQNQGEPEKPPSPFNTVYRLFIIPLMIVIVSISLFYAFGLLTFETKKPEDYLYEIKTGGDSKKWQAAYSLAGLLITEKNVSDETRRAFTKELTLLFNDTQRYNTRVRSYIALSLGYLKQKSAVPVLINALKETEEDIVLYSIWALAVIGDPEAQEKIIPFLKDGRPAIRKIAAYALGTFKDKKAIPALKEALKDPEQDVTWNAALSLAQLDDASGRAVLEKMLDREYLDTFPGLKEKEKETIMINSIKSVARLKLSGFLPILKQLAKSDPSLKVRQSAIEAEKMI